MSQPLGATKSNPSDAGVSQIIEQSKATATEDTKHVNTALCCDQMSTGQDQAVTKLKHNAVSWPCNLLMTEEELVARFIAEDEHPPTGRDRNTVLPSGNIRQARLHLSNNDIFRMMPDTGIISFKVDKKSFKKAGISRATIRYVIGAARWVSQVFTEENLGVTFAYAPDSDHEVFRICYDPDLDDPKCPDKLTLAEAFFPSEPPKDWRLRISPYALNKGYLREYPYFLEGILAHEFMHILGFRHWNAGSDKFEMEAKSFWIPDTADNNANTIMYTSVHKVHWLTDEDRMAVRWLYLHRNGALVCDNRVIRDVDRYSWHEVVMV